ncbi:MULTISPECIES: hypothetical protein [Pseudomonas]|uniref:hypothetical protein n=1 Tax=Pseudomonas TaxID=286 RepID=UPI000AB7A039|nr:MULTISPECIES: hypothetical protein [Pseudomonas]UXA36950.1 hypothetical protein KZA81_15665 [Pseudomonas juntendi]SUD78208.1 Uncharacterised protein [Pseudomonas putida]
MKVRALANISGPMGRKTIGDTFDVKAEEGRVLIENRQAEEVSSPDKASVTPKRAGSDQDA